MSLVITLPSQTMNTTSSSRRNVGHGRFRNNIRNLIGNWYAQGRPKIIENITTKTVVRETNVFVSPKAEPIVIIQLGGTFQRTGGEYENVGGGNQKVG